MSLKPEIDHLALQTQLSANALKTTIQMIASRSWPGDFGNFNYLRNGCPKALAIKF
ncbi:hypothetical protein [Adhaeribacter rhizoryzae]|uniref:hypothetical protein n=1 Tax=Adhaeribacter rhizoryzae TaxID=2607907 RepID=UPI00167FE106|nr:hypothetical protein [Adhaeribacter rhizoryzae]